MNALTGAPGASGTAPAAVKVALVIQVPPGYPIENFGYGQLQAADASQNDLLLKLPCTMSMQVHVSPDTANQTVTATFNPYPGAGPCAGHTYKVILFDGLGGNNPHQVGEITVAGSNPQVFRIAASGLPPPQPAPLYAPAPGTGVPCNPQLPHYLQKGCTADSGSQPPQAGLPPPAPAQLQPAPLAVPAPGRAFPCNPNIPNYSQQGCT